MSTIQHLIDAVRAEAHREPFPVDLPVYEKNGKDPQEPVLFAGNPSAAFCVFGRDLGKDEVRLGQPLIGAGGRLVREGLLRAFTQEAPLKADKTLEKALDFALLTNTVPYKPPGNKAYPDRVKERFRPFVAELLVSGWKGTRVITLGTEAFQWFARYASDDAARTFWAREARYEADFPCTLISASGEKPITVLPLPHPSPLNARWYKHFPGLLDRRLASLEA